MDFAPTLGEHCSARLLRLAWTQLGSLIREPPSLFDGFSDKRPASSGDDDRETPRSKAQILAASLICELPSPPSSSIAASLSTIAASPLIIFYHRGLRQRHSIRSEVPSMSGRPVAAARRAGGYLLGVFITVGLLMKKLIEVENIK
ncbi:unnamed protein product [Urochloa humidicola]